MRNPTLLWIAMGEGRRAGSPDIEFLRHCNCLITNRHHAREALNSGRAIDAVCFSFQHASMEGLQYVAAMKTRFPALPNILVLDFLSVETVLWAMRVGVFDVLRRPVPAPEAVRCMKRLRSALDLRPRQSERRRAEGAEMVPVETRFRKSTHVSEKLGAAASYIVQNYRQDVREQDLARRCAMSVFQFSRAFRAAHGVTFRKFLSDQRLGCARRLLDNQDISITDVAAISGFNDPSYFARVFRADAGVSPTVFREARARLLPPEVEESAGPADSPRVHFIPRINHLD